MEVAAAGSEPSDLIWKIVLLFCLILVNAFFAMSEIAIISLNDVKLQKMAEEGNKKAKKVLALVENPSSFLSTIQIGVTLAGFLTSASAAENFSEPLANIISGWLPNVPASLISGVSLVLVTIIISFFSLVLGELAPKRIAMQCGEKISFAVVGILLFIKSAMKPFIKLLSFSTNLVVRLFGFDPNASEETMTEEEIRMMVDAGEEKGVIEESQKEMINNIFEFDDIVAADVMTHRTDIEAVEINDKISDVIEKTVEAGYSRLPVFEEELDNIKGIIYVKDLLPYVGKRVPSEVKIADLMRSAEFVPESKRCGDLFNEMTEKRLQMIFVCDEYGGIAGLVTIEDLLESIVGNMQDEYDNEDEEFEQVNETTYTFDGTTDIEELTEVFGIQLPEGEYDTIGGYIMSELGRIPGEDEHPQVTYERLLFTVLEVDERRIERVKVELLPEEETEEETDEKPRKKDKE
ncbi:MAG: HlyC/CorC family transporter [Ruminococcaceae bacterium]|nr:HlyC/CorC family transporter [Oscillospiraceae bacterium]